MQFFIELFHLHKKYGISAVSYYVHEFWHHCHLLFSSYFFVCVVHEGYKFHSRLNEKRDSIPTVCILQFKRSCSLDVLHLTKTSRSELDGAMQVQHVGKLNTKISLTQRLQIDSLRSAVHHIVRVVQQMFFFHHRYRFRVALFVNAA